MKMDDKEKKSVLEYFMDVTGEKFSTIEKRFDRIDEKLEQLIGLRWMLIGGSAAISAIIGFVVAAFSLYIKSGG